MVARGILITVVAGALGACGGAAQGTVEVARAAGAMGAAREAGASQVPQAAGALDLAERELRRARAQLEVGDVEGARTWAARARADAGLSRMLAIEAATRGAAQRSEASALSLSQALENGGGAPKPPLAAGDARRAP